MTSSSPPGHGTEIVYRPILRTDMYEACVELQFQTWGRDYSDLVPAAILLVAQKIGGFVGGAFTRDDELLGFVFGLAALEDSAPYHWSHMLAVSETARGQGLGTGLKLLQRETVLERGLDRICWTFDPLEARNAHLNLNRLGGSILRYVPDMYGRATGSPLHKEIGTDRFVLEWDLNSDRTRRALASGRASDLSAFADAPVALAPLSCDRPSASSPARSTERPGLEPYPAAPRVRIAIPGSLQNFKDRYADLAKTWRIESRRCLTHYLANGYAVVGLLRSESDDVCYYCLTDFRTT